ncbi:ribosome biogenesis GTP-binding protein YsxC [Colletotrichum truncatum]|uniref:Ribosome biogenesis GTP-binding protein YsxC n=1 Tax=Colletotrichum truncatum TaxID=5467 RepID=A0ACC3ZCC0_COLTU
MRVDRGRDSRFSTSRTATPRTLRSLPPRSQPPPKKEPGLALIPKLSEEEQSKISTPKQLWAASSMFFTPPTRPKQSPQPRQQPQRGRNSAVASASAIRAAIRGLPEETPDSGVTSGGTIFAGTANDTSYGEANNFFRLPPATFLYSAFRFKQHPINTTTPEICIVGASNCGKSTFVNALTGASADRLAKVSDKAGKTVAMNAYGVGPLSGIPFRKPLSPDAAGEKPSQHGMILVDTPGYGHASRQEWGQEIAEYVNKRTMLKGVILLLSAEKKVSKQDEQVMKLLAGAGRPVMVVFTKMDKALRSRAREEGGIAERLREVERSFSYTGWDGWVPKIHLTAARMERDKSWGLDVAHSAAGMAGVRMAVLELAELKEFVAPERKLHVKRGKDEKHQAVVSNIKEEEPVEKEMGQKRQEPGKALESDPAAWSGKVVSFEELEKKFGDWSS